MKEKTINVLRWIGVLPVACLVYVLGYFVLMGINWLTVKFYIDTDGDGGWMNIYLWPIIATGVAGFYFVTAGSLLAPNNRKSVALVLMILICVLSGAAFLGVAITRSYSVIFAGIAQIVGAIISYQSFDENNEPKLL